MKKENKKYIKTFLVTFFSIFFYGTIIGLGFHFFRGLPLKLSLILGGAFYCFVFYVLEMRDQKRRERLRW